MGPKDGFMDTAASAVGEADVAVALPVVVDDDDDDDVVRVAVNCEPVVVVGPDDVVSEVDAVVVVSLLLPPYSLA